MTYTKEQGTDRLFTRAEMEDAWLEGYYTDLAPTQNATVFAKKYVTFIQTAREWNQDAPRIAPEASTTDQSRSGHLPPVGTPEEVLARVVASLMCRCAVMLQEQPGGECMFSTDWQTSVLDSLRAAYPILGTFEDAREEVEA